MEQKEFLRHIDGLIQYARTKENQLTKQEVADYCSELSLTGSSMNCYMPT